MRTPLAVAVFVLAHSAWSFEPLQVDVKQETFADHTESIDHLEPVTAPVPEDYYIAQFIESPSFTQGTYFVVQKTQEGRYALRLGSIPADSHLATVPPTQVDVEIPESLAKVTYQIWANALLEVRYDRKSYRGHDGSGYIFSTFLRGTGWLHGFIWSPDADLPPRWLVDSAHDLIAFARDPNRDAKKTEVALAQRRDKLLAYLKKHGKH